MLKTDAYRQAMAFAGVRLVHSTHGISRDPRQHIVDSDHHFLCSDKVGHLLGDVTGEEGPPRLSLPLERLDPTRHKALDDGLACRPCLLQLVDGPQ